MVSARIVKHRVINLTFVQLRVNLNVRLHNSCNLLFLDGSIFIGNIRNGDILPQLAHLWVKYRRLDPLFLADFQVFKGVLTIKFHDFLKFERD